MTDETETCKPRGPIHRAAHVCAKPINLLVERLHAEGVKHKDITRGSMCVIVVFAGAFMATHCPHIVPEAWHFVWDGVAYSIHGIGAAPICERVIALVVTTAED